jgi:hypothetical protein
VSRPAAQLTEEEQVKIAKRIGLIQHLPTGTYDGCKKNREYVSFFVSQDFLYTSYDPSQIQYPVFQFDW